MGKLIFDYCAKINTREINRCSMHKIKYARKLVEISIDSVCLFSHQNVIFLTIRKRKKEQNLKTLGELIVNTLKNIAWIYFRDPRIVRVFAIQILAKRSKIHENVQNYSR